MNEGVKQYQLQQEFVTESGFTFPDPVIAYKTWGKLNKARDNVILICHALTGNAAADEWFPGLFQAGGILDTDRYYVICTNVLGSCYGSTGPWTTDPRTGNPYRADFPDITIRDIVRYQQQFLDEFDIRGIETVIGGSMGGMQALEFSIMDERVRSAVPIAMGKAHTSWQIGISHAQRQAIFADPNWNDGYYEKGDGPSEGLSAARMMAMISYRCQQDFENKFGRDLQEGHDDLFQVESYLNYQGQKLVNRFDALTYVYLTWAMDTHDVARNRGSYSEILGEVDIPVLVIGINSDLLYPVNEQKELAQLLGNGHYEEITSEYGHDAFLIEFDQLNNIIKPFLSTYKTHHAV
ncbi:homoserine O-acetyltransferase [Halalkalibaculum sp. DA384]|uniref:homoserine O-acetyltransferase MetX n=1 Tax=Halalkalibaculum sp. DA384 TaxID=3373606 RepID=UPI003754232D